MKLLSTFSLLSLAGLVLGQGPPGVQRPLVERISDDGSIVAVNRYAAVLPYPFNRTVSTTDEEYDFRNTSVSSAPTFDLLSDASFVVYNRELAMQYLGDAPSYQFVFQVSEAVHEAPVFAPEQNLLFVSVLAPPPGHLPQLVINLNNNPPTIEDYIPNPPVYAPNGGTFRDGLVVFAASGANKSIGNTEQRISIRTVDPATNQSTVLLNNYFGFQFNCIDDLAVHPVTREIFFTDPQYSWFNGLSDTAPQLPTASYRFNPDTGATVLIDDTIVQPNGIAFTPDGETLYISDTGAVSGSIIPGTSGGGATFNTTGPRTIYAFDVANNGTKISNKRSFYLSQDWVPDGLKVAENGLVLTGAGKGVDVIAPTGELVMRIQTNYTVQNFAWVGEELKTLWIMGNYGISKVEWNVTGQRLT